MLACCRKRAFGLDDDLPGAAETVEIVDVQRSQVGFQRVGHVLERHVLLQGLLAVQIHVQLRHVGPEYRRQPHHALFALGFLGNQVGLFLQGGRAEVAAVLDHELEPAGPADAPDRRRPEDGEVGIEDFAVEPAAQRGGNGVRIQARVLPPVEIVQDHEHRAEVGAVAAQQERLAGNLESVLNAGRLQDDLLGPGHRLAVRSAEALSGSWALIIR